MKFKKIFKKGEISTPEPPLDQSLPILSCYITVYEYLYEMINGLVGLVTKGFIVLQQRLVKMERFTENAHPNVPEHVKHSIVSCQTVVLMTVSQAVNVPLDSSSKMVSVLQLTSVNVNTTDRDISLVKQ